MKKLILILSIIFCMIISGTALAFEKVDVSGFAWEDDPTVFVAKIQTLLDHGLGTSGTVVVYEEGNSILQVWGTCASTDGATIATPVYVHSILTGAGAIGRAGEFVLAPTAVMGSYGNALKGYLDMSGSQGSAGLLSGICAEILLPPSAMQGTFGVLELELVAPASFVASEGIAANSVAFIYAQASGAMVDEIDDHGYFLNLQGLTDATGNLFFDNTLKCAIGTTAWYVPLSSAQASYTTAYPIATSYAGTNAIEISGDCTNAINITSTGTTFGLLYDADFTAQIGSNVEGIKVMLERVADVTVATGSWIGAEFIIKKGDTGWSNKPASNVYGVRIAMDGSCTDASGSVIALRVETQGDGWVEHVGYFSVNNNGTLTGSVISVNAFENAPNGVVLACSNSATMAYGISFTDVNGGGTITNLFHLEDAANTTNFLLADTVEGCIDTTSGDESTFTGRIALSIAGQVRYLYYYD